MRRESGEREKRRERPNQVLVLPLLSLGGPPHDKEVDVKNVIFLLRKGER
jgi:hypothetical protein